MCYNELQCVTMSYNELQCVTMSYNVYYETMPYAPGVTFKKAFRVFVILN